MTRRNRRAQEPAVPVPASSRPNTTAPVDRPFHVVARTEPTVAGEATPDAAPARSSTRRRPMGLALVSRAAVHGARAYLCNPARHLIDILDQSYRPMLSFGGHGSAPGQLDTPIDVAIVSLADDREDDDPLLAVADRGNHRVQLFELDGAPLATIEGHDAATPNAGWPQRAGWPFFRITVLPPLTAPSRLEWRPPFLDVTCAGGSIVRVDLESALLPDFETWLHHASPADLTRAFRHFCAPEHVADVPSAHLVRIAERVEACDGGGEGRA